MNVLLVSEYTIGLAALMRAMEEFPDVDHVVTSGIWFGYTQEAKEYGLEHNVGVFIVNEFLGALNWSNPINYEKREADGEPRNRHESTA